MGKNNIKFSQEFVENYFKEKGCILLDTYINSHVQMKYVCKCGNETRISFTKFRTQKHGCKKCTKIGGYTQNWRCIRIISSKDKLPPDSNIIDMITYAKEILKNHSWIVFDIDNQEVLYNDYKEKYIFEKLKRIRNDYAS